MRLFRRRTPQPLLDLPGLEKTLEAIALDAHREIARGAQRYEAIRSAVQLAAAQGLRASVAPARSVEIAASKLDPEA